MSADTKRVKKRRVFHIPGYDPIHPRRYRELYRKEGAAQAQISGYQIALQAAASDDTFRWHVAAQIDGQDVAAQIDVLVWSDIVRESMAQSILATYLQLIKTAWIYISTGTLRRLMWMRKGPVIAALYPVVMLLTQLALALGFGSVIAGLAGRVIGESWFGWVLEWIIMLGVAGVVLRFFKSIDNKLFAYYLMHDYAFSANGAGTNPAALEQRMQRFADVIAEALQEDVDEVLIVGHSSGAHLAVSIIADLLRDGRLPPGGPALSFLSLGQVVPMLSFLPKATRLRRDLALLASAENLTWLDVSAPGDGCCFALCDPVAVSGVAPKDKKWPLVISAAFTQSLTPARWQALRWRFFRLHFQYLCAFDAPKDYDYFQITAGPRTLGARYADRKPSGSCIDLPISKYSSVAP